MKISNQGMTIVELVLYMGLLSIFLVVIVNLFSQLINTQTRSEAVSLVHVNGNILLSKLSHDIAQSDAVTTPLSIGSSSVVLVLRIGSTDYTYSLNNGRLQFNDGVNTYALNDADTAVSNFVVTRLGNLEGKNGLKFNFTITSLVVDETSTKSADFTTSVSTR